MKLTIRIAITLAVALLLTSCSSGAPDDFWEHHGVIFIVCMAFFPRLTLLFSSVATGGFFWWLGWLILPRTLVAILATSAYAHTNLVLVLLTWVWALSGEWFEKGYINGAVRAQGRRASESPIARS